jgi:sigma-70-like protein
MKGKLTQGADIDLGLAVSALSLTPGERRTTEELALFCGCTRQNISRIEQRALRKLRVKLQFQKDPFLAEAMNVMTGKVISLGRE